MKTFLITMLFLTVFTNCSTNNAFSHFDINENQAKSEDSLQSTKIFNKEKSEGIISAIYLNSVLPQEYNDKEYFYVYLYVKNNSKSIDFFLNGEKAQEIQTLASQNRFSNLTSFKGDWQKYYLLVFDKQDKEILTLQVKISQSASRKMVFQKED